MTSDPSKGKRAAARGGRSRAAQTSIDVLKGYLLLGGGFVFLAFFVYTNYLIARLERQSDTLAHMFARFCAVATVPASQDEGVRQIFNEVMRESHYPIIVTDSRGVPWTWKGIGIDLSDVPFETFYLTDPRDPHDATMKEILAIVGKMDSNHRPIAMRRPGDLYPMGYVHFGDSDLIKELKWIPFVQAGVVATFLLVVLFGYRSVKTSEQRSIWVGMAKETAHQLGTPISSLMGWVEILKERALSSTDGGGGASRDEMLKILAETETDLRRLEKIVSRFSHVGSAATLQKGDLVPVLRSSVEYLRRRFPQLSGDIDLRENYDPVPPILMNGELIEWVVENLVKNSLDAIDRHGGAIEIGTSYEPAAHRIKVTFADNGRGMSPGEQRRAFLPGFSTKRRGWGLGLPLARRIVEEYHNGKLVIARSAPGEGTVFELSLPIAPIAGAVDASRSADGARQRGRVRSAEEGIA